MTVNCSIGDKNKHFTPKELYDLLANARHKSHFTYRERYAITTIQDEALPQEIEWYMRDFDITQEQMNYIMSLDVYEKVNICKKINVDFANKAYKNQIEALQQFYTTAICLAIKNGMPQDGIVFGGGTALAIYYFQHRPSFDIDLFVRDRQFIDFLSPKHWIDDSQNFKNSYIDLAHHIRIHSQNNTKIDILVDEQNSDFTIDNSKKIFDFDVNIESLESIISKKIIHRGNQNKTRDIFDITVALENEPRIFEKMLSHNRLDEKHLLGLQNSLQTINSEKYNDGIEALSPFENYRHIAKNAKEKILEKLVFLKKDSDIKKTKHKGKH